ncbi:hypothetical protein GCM10027162_56900 [Streptomyces incanus]
MRYHPYGSTPVRHAAARPGAPDGGAGRPGAGTKVALITDPAPGPLQDEADVAFATGTGSRPVFDSYAVPGVLCAAPLQAMTDADPERTRARLDEHEQVADQHQFFLRD